MTKRRHGHKKHADAPAWNDPSVAFSETWRAAPLAGDMFDYYRQTGNDSFRELGLQGVDLMLALTGEEPGYPESMRPYEMATAILDMVKAWDVRGGKKTLHAQQPVSMIRSCLEGIG